MKVKLFLIGASSLLVVILAACESQPTPAVEPDGFEGTATPATIPQPIPVDDYESLVNALQAAGVTVAAGDAVEQPFFSVPGQVIRVNEQDVQVYVYETAEALEAEAAQIAEDGSSIGTSMVDWVEPPHFFKSGRILVLYLGEDPNILIVLESILGPQFAGRPT
jgi:hypothetical protein